MTSKEIKEKLRGYTKEQIINAISKISNRNYYESFVCDIIRIVDDEIYKNENNSIDKAKKEWEKASQEQIQYAKSLSEKYGKKIVKATELTQEEFLKYMELYEKEKETWENLEKLQEKQCRRLYDKGGM